MQAQTMTGVAPQDRLVRAIPRFDDDPTPDLQGPAARTPASHAAQQDADFISLQRAYRASGGLAHGDELAARLHADGSGGYVRLVRWIVARQLFSFSWHAHIWLPMFQFDPGELTLQPGLRPVLAELVDVMDGWTLASWFAQPSDALAGHSPVSMWKNHGPDVVQAARQQRCVMKG